MSHQVESRKYRLQANCLIVNSNSKIMPSMVFRQIADLSRYVQSYYLHFPSQMILDIEPIFSLEYKDYLPGWNDSLVTYSHSTKAHQ